MEIVYFFIAGAAGALVKDILVDNTLELPKRVDGKIALGFIGGMLVGGFTGWAVDQSILMAALAGFSGTSVLENLLNKRFRLKVQ